MARNDIFTDVIKKHQKRSEFDLSHDVKLSLDMGKLVPVYLQDCVPGDSIRINTSSMLRMAPLISPVMHKIDVYLEYFFVPNRLLWENWETFITGARNGKQLAADELPAMPTFKPFNNPQFLHDYGTLSDYFGIPLTSDFSVADAPSSDIQISALPFAAYQMIWDEYYRDQNLMKSVYDVIADADAFTPLANYNQLRDGLQEFDAVENQFGALRPRAWEHDYFTSALPWAQKGEMVTIPINLDPKTDTTGQTIAANIYPSDFENGTEFTDPNNLGLWQDDNAANPAHRKLKGDTTHVDRKGVVIDQPLMNTTTINDLRAAIKLQEWLETNARGGSRYFESIYAHFGVKSPDARLQRPEFIGSHRSNMTISEVFQTSSPQSMDDTPQGNLSGYGSAVGSSRNFSYYCQEHGYIIGLMSILPRTAYQQGIPKHFLKINDKLEFYFPEFAHLGEQEIVNMELYAGGTLEEAQGTFGYIPRYSEYKFMNSRVAGDFRDTLQFWHLGRIFEDNPNLNDMFIASDPSKRIYAVQDIPRTDEEGQSNSVRSFHSIYAHVYHDVKASRLMPKYGTPTL